MWAHHADQHQGFVIGYDSNPGLLPAYINSAKRALKLRTHCASNQDIEQHLELVFEGNVKVAWHQFNFESDEHMSGFHAVSQNTVQHPIAIHGQVSSVRCGLKGDTSKKVINL
jgi:CRISPR/Cas system CMR-associated protein Cmr3 (group 5 of RAMP superfamily)